MADTPEGSELLLVEVRGVHLGFLPYELADLHEGGSAVRSQDGFSVSPHSSEGAMSTREVPSSVGLLRATMAPPNMKTPVSDDLVFCFWAVDCNG